MGRKKEPMRCMACGHEWFFYEEHQPLAGACEDLLGMFCDECEAPYEFQVFINAQDEGAEKETCKRQRSRGPT